MVPASDLANNEVVHTEKEIVRGINGTSFKSLSSVVREKNGASFKLPKLPQPFLCISLLKDSIQVKTDVSPTEASARLSASTIVEANIVAACRLTASDSSVKNTLQLTLEFKGNSLHYEPGDSFGFFCHNPPEEVTQLLQCLGVEQVADDLREISSLGKKAPSHLPQFSSLRHIFTSCVDIRCVPKKVFLRLLASFTKDAEECRVLEFLSSHEGSSFYTECVRKHSLFLLGLLKVFQSCHPPVERILEHLPPLKPRFYSVASSPLWSEKSFRIIFNVISLQCDDMLQCVKKGICTGWFERLTEEMLTRQRPSENVLDLSGLHLNDLPQPSVYLYKRQNKTFLLPNDTSLPLIMIGPGTGVAPFLGFLQHREAQMKNSASKRNFGETWLFYGCRFKEKDYLCRTELERFHSCGVLSQLIVCFSQDESSTCLPRYVQDNIVKYFSCLVKAIEKGAVIYVCGDANHMTQNVHQAFIRSFMDAKNCSENEARHILKELEKSNQYLVDMWV